MTRPKKVWLLAKYWATPSTLELAQNAFLEAGACGLEIDDGISPEHPPKYGSDSILVLAYFEPAPGLKDKVTQYLTTFFDNCDLLAAPVQFSDIVEEDWQGNFVRSCRTFMVEPRIFVVPSFEIDEFKKNPQGDLFIEMDPENAFGTGQHQTTKLCLKKIAEMLLDMPQEQRAKMRAIDVGTGSGILAILMKKLGLGDVVATENDHDAVLTAQKNSLKNNVIVEVIFVDEEYVYPQEGFNLLVANILAPTLADMAKELVSACVVGGTIMLSGILIQQAEKVIATYEKLGAALVEQEYMDDWCVLIFARV